MNNEYAIALDMDGVLVDFDKGVKDAFRLDTKQLNKSRSDMSPDEKKSKNALYAGIVKKGVEFWENLEPTDDGMRLWEYVSSNFNNVYVLTAYISSGTENCIAGKKLWVKNHLRLNPTPRNFICVKSKEKQDYVNHLPLPTILIDDRSKNIQEWEAAGGIGILHTDTASTIRKLKEITKGA